MGKYLLMSRFGCGFGAGCSERAQAYCYETSDPANPHKKRLGYSMYSKVMPMVIRSEAEKICGPICSACSTCKGFNWIADMNGIRNGCWFRKLPDCQMKANYLRDCYKRDV